MQHLLHQSWLMIANGDGISAKRRQPWGHHLIWAIDGGADWCHNHGIVPTIISGDFDSLQRRDRWGIKAQHSAKDDLVPYPGKDGTTIIFTDDQNRTDTHKALALACRFHAKSLVLTHAAGHRMDHFLHHLELMLMFYDPNRPLIMLSRDFDARIIQQQHMHIRNQQGCAFACFGAPEASITSTGLRYDMQHHRVAWGQSSSVSNTIGQNEAVVQVAGTAMVLLAPNEHQNSSVHVTEAPTR